MTAYIADLAEIRRELIVRRARLMVGGAVPRAVFEGCFAAFLGALRGTAKPGRWDSRAVDAIARQISRVCAADASDDEIDALRRAHQSVGGGLSDPELTAVDHIPIGTDPFGVAFSELDVDPDLYDLAPRPTLVFAMEDFGKSAVTEESPVRPRVLLRLRSDEVEAARSIRAAAEEAARSGVGLRLLPSAPDEVLVGSEREASAGALDLLQLVSVVLGERTPEVRARVSGALVGVREDDADLAAAAVEAGARAARPGLVAVADPLMSDLEEIAWVPGSPGVVDPAAISRSDRWEQSALLSRPPLVGRDDELAELAGILDEATVRDGGTLVHLRGAEGLGKRALLRAALARLGYDDERAPVLFGAVPRAPRRVKREDPDRLGAPPYGPVAAMLRALAGAPAGAGEARKRLSRLVAGLWAALDDEDARELGNLEDVLAYLLGIADKNEVRRVDGLGARSLQVAIRRAVLLVVRALARRGDRTPLLVITGAEALDGPTRDLLAFLARRQQRLVIVAVTAGRWRVPRQLAELTSVKHAVSALDANAALELQRAVLDDAEIEGELGRLAERGRGSPLALIHLVRTAVESGRLRHEELDWKLDLAGASFPARLDRLLQDRVSRLPEGERRVLGCCAVLGPSFLAEPLRQVARHLGLQRSEVDRALARLTEIGFLARAASRPGAPAFPDPSLPLPERYAFEHPLLADAAAGALDDDERDAAHAAAADALEAVLGGDARSIATSLARHLLRSGNERRALPYLHDAARRALRLDAPTLARKAAERALQVAPEDQRLAFLLDLERARGAEGDTLGQADALRSLVRLAERGGVSSELGRAYLRLARFHIFHGDASRAGAACDLAMPALRAAEDTRGLAEACRVRALCRFERRDLHGAIEALRAAAGHSAGDPRGLAVVEHQLGAFTLEAGDAPAALEHLMRARALRRQSRDLAGEAACLDIAADAFARRGRLNTAMEVLGSAIELRDRIGDDGGRASSLRHLAEVALSGGDAARARALALDARDLGRQLGLERLERHAVLIAARGHLLEGNAKDAERLLDNLRRRVDAETDPFATMEAALFSARAKRLRAQKARTRAARDRLLQTALERAKQATRIGEEHGYATGQVLGMATTGEVLLEQGDAPGALLYAQRAAELAQDRRATGLPVEIAHLAHARAQEALGDVDEARLAVARAMDALRRRAEGLNNEWTVRFWSVGARRECKEMSDRLASEAL